MIDQRLHADTFDYDDDSAIVDLYQLACDPGNVMFLYPQRPEVAAMSDVQGSSEMPARPTLAMACPNTWGAYCTEWSPWGGPHGCRRAPGHLGVCECLCESRHARPK